jgi:golgi phosphoprotein 3
MNTWDKLHLYEEVMLLALKDREGKPELGSMYQYALGGALLAELLGSNRVRLVDDNRRVSLIDTTPLGDILLDHCLEQISKARKQKKTADWVAAFAAVKDLKHKAVAGLCSRGILRREEKKVLLLFTSKLYPQVDPTPEREVVERLRAAVFTQGADVEPRTVLLVALAGASDLLKMVFDKKDLKAAGERIERLVDSSPISKATRKAVEAAQAAAISVATSAAIS